MITRIWHGRTPIEKGASYLEFVTKTGIDDYRNTPGNLGARVIQLPEGDVMHVWTVSDWQDFKAVENFSGKDISVAHYYDNDKKYLLEFEPHVLHYETTDNILHDYLLNQLIQIYSAGAWFGETFLEKLNDVSETTAFTQPNNNTHSIAEIVAHCTYWRKIALKLIGGDFSVKGSMKSPDNWPALLSLKEKGWPMIWALFQQSQIELVNQILCTSIESLHQGFKSGLTLLQLLEGIIQHDIYHLGQIGMVKKMAMGSLPPI
jgi:uncharacterized damage-inducible protein DinB